MAEISTTSWSEVDAGNNQPNPSGWPDGMNANGVEPTARAGMGGVKRFWNRVNPTYLAALATTDSFTVTPTQAITGYGLAELWNVRFPSANTSTSPNVLISALPAQQIRKFSTSGTIVNLAAGDIQAKDHAFYWDGTQVILTNPVVVAPNAGTVTSIATGGLATGGTIVSSGTVSVNASSKAQMQTGTDNVTAVTPVRVNDHDGVAKAWLYGSNSGTIIASSSNINALVRNSVGDYTATFAVPFTNGNYVAFVTPEDGTGNNTSAFVASKSTSNTRVFIHRAGVATDLNFDVVWFGRQ